MIGGAEPTDFILYIKWGSKDIAIWNPVMKKWDIKLHFQSEWGRNGYFRTQIEGTDNDGTPHIRNLK